MHLLINFCLITFICYAVAYPVRVILFSAPQRTRLCPVHRTAGSALPCVNDLEVERGQSCGTKE